MVGACICACVLWLVEQACIAAGPLQPSDIRQASSGVHLPSISVCKVLKEAVAANGFIVLLQVHCTSESIGCDEAVQKPVHDALDQQLLPMPPFHSFVAHLLRSAADKSKIGCQLW